MIYELFDSPPTPQEAQRFRYPDLDKGSLLEGDASVGLPGKWKRLLQPLLLHTTKYLNLCLFTVFNRYLRL